MASLILQDPNGAQLWIGDLYDGLASHKMHLTIDVHEAPVRLAFEQPFIREVNIPIAHALPPDYQRMKADRNQLNKVAAMIDEYLKDGKRVMVHCQMGSERSPLAVVWYLHRYRKMSLSNAFYFVRSRRPIAQNCLDWL